MCSVIYTSIGDYLKYDVCLDRTVINIMNMIIAQFRYRRDMEGIEDEYNKGFFTAAYVYGNTHIYILYIYY